MPSPVNRRARNGRKNVTDLRLARLIRRRGWLANSQTGGETRRDSRSPMGQRVVWGSRWPRDCPTTRRSRNPFEATGAWHSQRKGPGDSYTRALLRPRKTCFSLRQPVSPRTRPRVSRDGPSTPLPPESPCVESVPAPCRPTPGGHRRHCSTRRQPESRC